MKRALKGVVAAAGWLALAVYGAGVTPAAASTAATEAAHPTSLPVGAATGFPFGYVMDEGAKISLLPPNDKDVNQARVNSAPKLGPFKINTNGNFAGWPNACKLTSLAQLKALEPAITGLKGAPVGQKAEVLNTGRPTPNNTQCQFNLKTKFDPAGYTTASWVELQLQEIDSGSPSTYKQALATQKAESHKYPAQYADYPNLKNGVQCFDDSTELQCLKGDIDFWISGQKVTGGDQTGSDQAVWIDQIEIPLAEVLGAELKPTA
jgi:hypothetical protein